MPRLPVTERLTFFELTPEDAAHVFALNSNPEVIKYTGDPPFASVSEAQSFLENYTDYRDNGYGRWGLSTVEQPFIGWCGLKLHGDGSVDLGFRLMRHHWNQGYATEAGIASLQYGFHELEIEEVIGRAMKVNIGSIHVLKKLGMTFLRHESNDLHNAEVYHIHKNTFLKHVTAEPPRLI